jgi:hypothetical protein
MASNGGTDVAVDDDITLSVLADVPIEASAASADMDVDKTDKNINSEKVCSTVHLLCINFPYGVYTNV